MNLNDSTEGRWLTPNLLGGDITNPQSLNRYAYALNNPTTLTDPSGLDPCTIDGQPAICVTSTATAPDQPPFYIGPCSYEAIEEAACYGGSSPAPPGWYEGSTSGGTSTPPPAPKPNIIPWPQIQSLVHANNEFSEPNESDNYCDDVVDCIVFKESTAHGGFNANALGRPFTPPEGGGTQQAKGLMQITQNTATTINNVYQMATSGAALYQGLFNPAINIMAGSNYLQYLYGRYGNLSTALSHYGPSGYANDVLNCVQQLQRGNVSGAEAAAHGIH